MKREQGRTANGTPISSRRASVHSTEPRARSRRRAASTAKRPRPGSTLARRGEDDATARRSEAAAGTVWDRGSGFTSSRRRAESRRAAAAKQPLGTGVSREGESPRRGCEASCLQAVVVARPESALADSGLRRIKSCGAGPASPTSSGRGEMSRPGAEARPACLPKRTARCARRAARPGYVRLLIGEDERHADAAAPGATGSTDAMDISGVLGGRIEVDDVRDVRQIEAASGDVGRNQRRRLPGLESLQGALALVLVQVTVERNRVDLMEDELLDEPVAAARADEGGRDRPLGGALRASRLREEETCSTDGSQGAASWWTRRPPRRAGRETVCRWGRTMRSTCGLKPRSMRSASSSTRSSQHRGW